MKRELKGKIICLIGPTAVGKTEVAIALAKKIGAEIISCDSMQVYKGIDIATSKPTPRQRRQIPHHLIDLVSPSQEYNAARFKSVAQKAIAAIHKKGKLPLLVGGTGLYLKAILDGLFRGPGQSMRLRKRLMQEAQKYGRDFLYQRLKKIDPEAARAIHPHDLRRIIRAVEVYEKTGLPISQLQVKTKGLKDKYTIYIFALTRPRAELYARIEKRVERMFRRGLVAEIKHLTEQKMSKTAKSLLGYKEVSGFLHGRYSSLEAKRLLKRNTRRYAKRQLSWFKHEQGVKWIEVVHNDSAGSVVKKILNEMPNVGDRKR